MLTQQKILLKTGLNNVVLPTFLYVVKAILNNIIEREPGVPMLNNIVDNIEQCGQQKIFESWFHQP